MPVPHIQSVNDKLRPHGRKEGLTRTADGGHGEGYFRCWAALLVQEALTLTHPGPASSWAT